MALRTDHSGKPLAVTHTVGVSYDRDGDAWYMWSDHKYHAAGDPADVYECCYSSASLPAQSLMPADPSAPTDAEAHMALGLLISQGELPDGSLLVLWSDPRGPCMHSVEPDDPTWRVIPPTDEKGAR